MDLRICHVNQGEYYDVCNVEFAKDGDIKKKCASDAAKVMLEGKCILDQIARLSKLKKDKVKDLEVFNMQFCGKVYFLLKFIWSSPNYCFNFRFERGCYQHSV